MKGMEMEATGGRPVVSVSPQASISSRKPSAAKSRAENSSGWSFRASAEAVPTWDWPLDESKAGDAKFDVDGVAVLADKMVMNYLEMYGGAAIDYVEKPLDGLRFLGQVGRPRRDVPD